AGEMAKLRGLEREAVNEAPLAVAHAAAKELGVLVVLKGPRTFVVTPAGRALEHRGGNAGLGTSGSGDVLAGVVGGLAARGATPAQAAAFGVYAHGRAGVILARRVAPLGYLASELLAEIPRALARFER
ncbi:MAG: hydroxyethylthiazole kinase, partial [Deltaproteobacteria bacterium]|nr:hydroxyethylthiazole kinase [Deltaproteobacteria bacterium]